VEKMAKKWFTSDQHLGHRNIIKYCNRPFSSVEEMDERIIVLWQSIVMPEDIVYVLGDFSFHEPSKTTKILSRLPGHKVLIKGNHDNKKRLNKIRGWGSIKDYHELKFGETRVVLCHYPIQEWRAKGKGSFHLHGHSHGRQSPNMRRLDVGVDSWDFYPLCEQEIILHLKDIPFELNDRDL
jgi:calcineurin-like phosphoesterase family protein